MAILVSQALQGRLIATRTMMKMALKLKWAGNQEAVTFLGYRPIRS
jgi:hypothetical protein